MTRLNGRRISDPGAVFEVWCYEMPRETQEKISAALIVAEEKVARRKLTTSISAAAIVLLLVAVAVFCLEIL